MLAVSLSLIAAREIFMKTIRGTRRNLAPVEDKAASTVNKAEDATSRPVIYQRLPGDVVGDLMAISGSDHTVRVLTDCGSTSIRLRFSDALREVEGVSGLRVHRSHWVADAAVSPFRRLVVWR